MKIFLYSEGERYIKNSGLGKAIEHQQEALRYQGIEYTCDGREDYDILHINTWYPGSYLTARAAKRHGKKIVYHAHSTEEDYRNGFILANQTSKLIKWWLIRCYRLGDVILTPTEYSRSLLQTYTGLNNKTIYAISNGIDLRVFHRDAECGTLFRKKYGFSDKDKVIIGIGLYIRRKGIVDFIELARRMPDYRFIWFGYSPLSVATFDVRRTIHKKPENMILAGHVDREEIRNALNGCDLFLFPTYEETEGIPILEALACQTKTVVRDIPIFKEYNEKMNIYKAGSIQEFEAVIRQVIDRPNMQDIELTFKILASRDIRHVSEQLRSVYEMLISDNDGDQKMADLSHIS